MRSLAAAVHVDRAIAAYTDAAVRNENSLAWLNVGQAAMLAGLAALCALSVAIGDALSWTGQDFTDAANAVYYALSAAAVAALALLRGVPLMAVMNMPLASPVLDAGESCITRVMSGRVPPPALDRV